MLNVDLRWGIYIIYPHIRQSYWLFLKMLLNFVHFENINCTHLNLLNTHLIFPDEANKIIIFIID